MEQIGTPSTTNASSTIITSTPTTTSNTSLSTSSSLSTTSGGVIVTNDPSSSSDDKLGLSSVLGSTTASASGIVSTPLSTLSGHKTPKRVTSSVSSPVLSPPTGKILGRNSNGTMVNTSMPSNEAELQLYRVLQKASLLAYYDTLLEMGGDDVKQLCDAGEDEFLEIMALVGMASKPLHVRRLQKALHEWMMNPAAFQTPLPNIDAPQTAFSPEPGSISQQLQQQQQQQQQRSLSSQFNVGQSCVAHSPVSSLSAPGPAFCNLTSAMGTHSTISSSSVATSISLTPSLTDSQIARIVSSAERLARTLPQLEPRIQSSKKRSARELEQVIAMNESDPRRMDEIRKYSAIYGRFDCKRKPEKPLTLHEVCVNEAAAQICKYIPALLTRRDELFPLARQVVRDSGFGHSATIRLMSQAQNNRNEENDQQAKRTRLSSTGGSGSDLGKESMDDMREKTSIFSKITKPFDLSDATKLSLVLNASQQVSQQHLRDSFMKNFCRYSNSEFDDNDSRFSFSNSDSSPQHNGNGIDRDMIDTTSDLMETRGDDLTKSLDTSPLGVQVISSSGNTIIAVANPALALSPIGEITVKREALSPDL